MTEREKLIELLKSPHKAEQLRQMGTDIGAYQDDCIEAMIADFLLANGVTVRVNEEVQMVPKAAADQWYHEYHVLKDALKTEKMYHRETERLADKYFAECKHLQEMLEATIAGQETLQRYFLSKDSPDGIRLRYNEATGEWDKYEPYMTIECPEEKDYEFLATALAKQTLKKPSKESLADYGCPVCGAYINFDGLNGKPEHAPKYCSECGQRFDWRADNELKTD